MLDDGRVPFSSLPRRIGCEFNAELFMSYKRFFAMIAASVVVMFCLMYLNSYQILDHAWFSETRVFMALIMGGAMMIVMLAFMLPVPDFRATPE